MLEQLQVEGLGTEMYPQNGIHRSRSSDYSNEEGWGKT